jgi:hypothetical protein
MLAITYVAKYPDEVPRIELADVKGLDESNVMEMTARLTGVVCHGLDKQVF